MAKILLQEQLGYIQRWRGSYTAMNEPENSMR